MSMLADVKSVDEVDAYLDEKFKIKKIMGFGHRVYKDGDPRAKYLREMSRKSLLKLVEVNYMIFQ